MKKLIKYLVICLLFVPNTVSANYFERTEEELFSINGYYINSYNIDIIVNENNSFDITENIEVNFTGANKQGILRIIPTTNKVIRPNNVTTNNANIKNIDVNHKFTTYREPGFKIIKIGDPKINLNGKQNYIIKYNYNIGKDPLKNMDELYFNIIGNDWDTNIKNITFNITMSKSFDKSSLTFTSGKNEPNDNVEYDAAGNKITGRVISDLNDKEALTVYLELPEGYFVNAKYQIDDLALILIIIPLSLVLLTLLLWLKFGKDKKVVETIEFYPLGYITTIS